MSTPAIDPAAFVHLDVISCFSFRRGAAHPEALAQQAAQLGYHTLALTDWHGPYGAPRFVQAARAAGLRPLIGATVTVTPGGRLVLLVRDAAGWSNLCRLLSTANMAGRKEQPYLDIATLAAHTDGLIALCGPSSDVAARLLDGDHDTAQQALTSLRTLFDNALWLELVDHCTVADRRRNRALAQLGRELGVGLVATNMVHYATPADAPLHDVLTCVREHTRLAEADLRLAPNHEAYLKPAAAMAELFAWAPAAVANTARVADLCTFTLDTLDGRLPAFPLPPGETAFSYLHQLATSGARARYQPLTPAVARQLAHELEVIERLSLSDYFLIVWDICRFARERGILCQGRGSAANSVVAYALGITNVDPIGLNLLFERFLSEERAEMPDIDLDFANDRREEVIQYLYERYGRDRAGMVCEYICYRRRSALRDVGQALALPADHLRRLARTAPPEDLADSPATPPNPQQQLAHLCARIEGMPRHLGIHVGGMVITARLLVDLVPLERARLSGRTVTIWDKDDLATLRMVKIDLLGLGMLSLLGTCLRLIHETRGVELDLGRLTPDDPSVYEMLGRADTVGLFQVESRAQMSVLPRLRPRSFYDLVVQVAIIRPGPIQGGSVHPYIRRRRGEEPVSYLHPSLEPLLERTLGVPLFQEQGMRVAMAVAGFSAGEADSLRRAMGARRSSAAMRALEERFWAGARTRGLADETIRHIWRQLAAFADYGFPESHAASFALLVYQSAYLRRYYPAEYTCSLLNHQPMGFYSPGVIVGDARRHGIPILRPDVRFSHYDWTLERQPDGALGLRVGLRCVQGIGPEQGAHLTDHLRHGHYRNLSDFRQRSGLSPTALANLAACGALECFERDRRRALWAVGAPAAPPGALPALLADGPAPQLQPMTAAEHLLEDYRVLGFSPAGHVLELSRARLARQGIHTLHTLAHQPAGARLRIAGLVVVVQRPPTARGMCFVTLEDETGLGNLVLRPAVEERYRHLLHDCPLLIAEGTIERVDDVTHMVVSRLVPLHGHHARAASR